MTNSQTTLKDALERLDAMCRNADRHTHSRERIPRILDGSECLEVDYEEAWLTVCHTLSEINPEWFVNNKRNVIENAEHTIRSLINKSSS